MADNCAENSAPHRAKHLTSRERGALVALGVFALAALACWRPIRHQALTALVLRSDAPAAAVLTEVVEGTSNPARTLERLWRAGSFSGRSFVVSYLLCQASSRPALLRQMEPLLEEAAWDADLETREAAFSALIQEKNPSARRWLREQLSDADPAVRALAVQQLARVANSNDVPAAIRLLDDPDPRVIAVTGSFLKRVTGQDFGLKTSLALPTFAWKPDAPPAPVDAEALQSGRRSWQAWWQLHQSEFPADNDVPPSPGRVYPRPTPEFALEEVEGRRVRLSDFRGKAVLLTFWNLSNTLNFGDEAVLQALLQKRSASLAVLAVAVDPAAWPEDCCDGHEGGHGEATEGHEHSPAQCHEATSEPDKTQTDAHTLAAHLGTPHPVLLDPQGALIARYDVHDLPAYVLIDAQGNLRRRFFGTRTAAVFEAMIAEAAGSNATPTRAEARPTSAMNSLRDSAR